MWEGVDRMAELTNTLNEQIQRLCVEGNDLVKQQRYENALARFSSAWLFDKTNRPSLVM